MSLRLLDNPNEKFTRVILIKIPSPTCTGVSLATLLLFKRILLSFISCLFIFFRGRPYLSLTIFTNLFWSILRIGNPILFLWFTQFSIYIYYDTYLFNFFIPDTITLFTHILLTQNEGKWDKDSYVPPNAWIAVWIWNTQIFRANVG